MTRVETPLGRHRIPMPWLEQVDEHPHQVGELVVKPQDGLEQEVKHLRMVVPEDVHLRLVSMGVVRPLGPVQVEARRPTRMDKPMRVVGRQHRNMARAGLRE